jgi:hypothetical protein
MKNLYYSVAPWETEDYATSTKEDGKGQTATNDIKPFGLGGSYPFKGKFVISWLSKPYFEPEDGEECGFRMRRDLILEIPHEQFNDELFCSLFGENVILPLKEDDVIEASLIFQAYEWHGEGHQTIHVYDVKKIN